MLLREPLSSTVGLLYTLYVRKATLRDMPREPREAMFDRIGYEVAPSVDDPFGEGGEGLKGGYRSAGTLLMRLDAWERRMW